MAGYPYPPNYGNQSYPVEERIPVGQYQDPNGPTHPPLVRSISFTDLETVQKCKNMVTRDLVGDIPRGGTTFFPSTPNFTLTLPSLDNYPQDCRQFAFDKIVDKPSQKQLEEENVINWCGDSVTTLVPLKTEPDGNCLLHSASLGMWGFQDRDLTLRSALWTALRRHDMNSLYRRWKFSREVENRRLQMELEPHQWDDEWETVVQQASLDIPVGKNLQSLDEFHVFVLANILRRPIIMYAAPKIRSLRGAGTLQEGSIQGVYLPLLWHPGSCKKNPLPLSYNNGHFSALVVIESPQQYKDGLFVLPLVDYCGQQLPMKFALDVSAEEPTTLVMDYLNPLQMKHRAVYVTSEHIICTKLTVVDAPACFKALLSHFIDACMNAFRYQTEGGGGGGVRGRDQNIIPGGGGGGGHDRNIIPGGVGYDRNIIPGGGGGGVGYDRNIIPRGESERGGEEEKGREVSERETCINNCGMFGDPQHAYMCSECFRKSRDAENQNQIGANDRQYGNQPQVQHRQEPFSGTGGDQRNQSNTSLGTVKCPKCPEPGHPQFLGMCKRCYGNNTGFQQQKEQQQDGIYEILPHGASSQTKPSPSPPSIPPPRVTNERSQCRKPGCDFYGTKETRFYCSKCFDSNMENILKEVDNGSSSRPVVSPPLSPPARVEPGVSVVNNPPSSDKDPPLCRQCNHFFGNEEYNGLCHGCFMKLTISGKPLPPSNESDFGRSKTYTAPQQQQRQQEQPGYYDQNMPRTSHHQGPSYPSGSDEVLPRPLPRRSNTTAHVTHLSSRMTDTTPTCFLCLGTAMGTSSSYTICAKHAASMSRMFQLHEGGGGGGEEEVKSKSANPGRYSDDAERERGQRNDARGYRDDTRDDTRGHRDDTRGYRDDTGHRDDTRGYRDDTGHRDDTRGYKEDARGYRDDGRGYRDDTRGYRDDGNKFDQRPQEDPRIYPNQKDNKPDYSDYSSQQPHQIRNYPLPPQNYEQHYPPHPPPPHSKPGNMAGAGGGGGGGGGRDLEDAGRNAGGEASGGGGAGAGGSAGAGGGANIPVRKKALCATVGCSFKGYMKLHDLCPDCYREHYTEEIDEDVFPLV